MHPEVRAVLAKPIVAKILCLLLVLLILWQLSVSIHAIIALKQGAPQLETVKAVSIEPQSQESLKVGIFGEYLPDSLDSFNIKKSRLNLKVVGIIYGESEDNSQVLVQVSEGHEKFYKIGDELPGGGQVKRIRPDGIVISRNGKLESLSLPKDPLTNSRVPEPLVEE